MRHLAFLLWGSISIRIGLVILCNKPSQNLVYNKETFLGLITCSSQVDQTLFLHLFHFETQPDGTISGIRGKRDHGKPGANP